MEEHGQPLDVCIDTAGSIVGAGLYTTYYLVYKSGYKKAVLEEKNEIIKNKGLHCKKNNIKC